MNRDTCESLRKDRNRKPKMRACVGIGVKIEVISCRSNLNPHSYFYTNLNLEHHSGSNL